MKLTEAQAWAAIGDMLYAEAGPLPGRVDPTCSLPWCIDSVWDNDLLTDEQCHLMLRRESFCRLGFADTEWEPRAMLCWLLAGVTENE